jgi:hypothetical protein
VLHQPSLKLRLASQPYGLFNIRCKPTIWFVQYSLQANLMVCLIFAASQTYGLFNIRSKPTLW